MPASRQDLVIAYNENHDINLKFETDNCDGTTSPFTGTNYVCHLMIKENNSDADDAALARYQLPLSGDTLTFSILPDEVKHIGEGEKWFDIWLTNEDNGNYHKPLIYGTYTVQMLSTRGF